MRRSEINAILREGERFFEERGQMLPAWASWPPERWKGLRAEADEVARAGLGWDITDFGSGDYPRRGLFLFTLRNGIAGGGGKPYAEKAMIVGAGQETPTHFHHAKMEDIINRGGGILVMELWNADASEALATGPVRVRVDGMTRTVPAGTPLRLRPGESVCLETRVYHRFYGEGGRVLVGEVSAVNDDSADNRFLEEVGRFPAIEEDELPYRLLVSDYLAWL